MHQLEIAVFLGKIRDNFKFLFISCWSSDAVSTGDLHVRLTVYIMSEIVSPETMKLFEQLRHDTLHLHKRWKYFRQLFADESGERIELLKHTASRFFFVVQWLFLHDTCLGLCRLTDPSQSAGRDNLVLARLVEAVEAELPNAVVGADLRDAWESAGEATSSFRSIRNRSLAHRDLHAAQSRSDNPLPGISRQSIEDALAAVVNVLDIFEAEFLNSNTDYRSTITPFDGRWLLQALERARRYEQLEKEGSVSSVELPPLDTGM